MLRGSAVRSPRAAPSPQQRVDDRHDRRDVHDLENDLGPDADDLWQGERHEEIQNNILSTRLLAENEVIPYAILTPDGDWHQKGKMGWFGCSSDEMSEEEWKKEALKIYRQHEGKYVGIGLDCHI